jgi:hypothetical protein
MVNDAFVQDVLNAAQIYRTSFRMKVWYYYLSKLVTHEL